MDQLLWMKRLAVPVNQKVTCKTRKIKKNEMKFKKEAYLGKTKHMLSPALRLNAE